MGLIHNVLVPGLILITESNLSNTQLLRIQYWGCASHWT